MSVPSADPPASSAASTPGPPADGRRVHASNRLGLDFDAEGARLAAPPRPIIDAHAHIHGTEAARIYARAADRYGVGLTYSMTWIDGVDEVRRTLGDRIRFIAFPRVQRMVDERSRPGMGLVDQVNEFHALGARMLKFWVAPRLLDFVEDLPRAVQRLDAAPRLAAMERAAELDMMFMVHVADPDTWFRTTYADAARYGTKAEQYEPFEAVLDRFPQPWIAAHMGGWPEDLDFLDGLLERHDNLHLDTSATKWIVRELSKHPRERTRAFFERWQDRILFGSDIVTTDEHLTREPGEHPMHDKAGAPDEAFDLYASRYWALRKLLETEHGGPSPISDPDLHMVWPEHHAPEDAPDLRGVGLGEGVLDKIMHGNAARLLGRYYDPVCPLPAGLA